MQEEGKLGRLAFNALFHSLQEMVSYIFPLFGVAWTMTLVAELFHVWEVVLAYNQSWTAALFCTLTTIFDDI